MRRFSCLALSRVRLRRGMPELWFTMGKVLIMAQQRDLRSICNNRIFALSDGEKNKNNRKTTLSNSEPSIHTVGRRRRRRRRLVSIHMRNMYIGA